jgi:hypothetical protein
MSTTDAYLKTDVKNANNPQQVYEKAGFSGFFSSLYRSRSKVYELGQDGHSKGMPHPRTNFLVQNNLDQFHEKSNLSQCAGVT